MIVTIPVVVFITKLFSLQSTFFPGIDTLDAFPKENTSLVCSQLPTKRCRYGRVEGTNTRIKSSAIFSVPIPRQMAKYTKRGIAPGVNLIFDIIRCAREFTSCSVSILLFSFYIETPQSSDKCGKME